MFNFRIDTADARAALDKLDEQALAHDIANAVADEAVRPELAKAPMRSGKPQPFKSSKQRRYFFAALRKGQIQVPYRRSGKIGATEKVQTGNGVDVVVPASYSDLVRTKGKQAEYHQGVWPTTDEIAAKIEGDTAELIGTAEVIRALQKAGLT